MDNTIFIKGNEVYVKPMITSIEAIKDKKPLTIPKGYKSFAWVVNFLSLFYSELQELLKPLNDLAGRVFHWRTEQHEAFNEIKKWFPKSPILYMPDNKERFHLYSDASMLATGSAFYQIHNGHSRLIVYTSKQMPLAAQSYSITELVLCGLAINITSFSHLLKLINFDAVVDLLALTHIMKSK